ncbi:MAG TPA: GNAT family N-acetyltransferase [Dehalococcoidia bacterium]|nr:GNAT family N-acetyltransferase [Dehalococcoidia bacterium]
MDDGRLIQLQAETLFTYDARGRMLRDNYPEGGAAPRLFVGRTLHGDLLRFGVSLPEPLVARLAALLAQEPPARELRAEPAVAPSLMQTLAEHGPVTAHGGGPTYACLATLPEPAGVVRITAANAALVQQAFPVLFRTLSAVPLCFAVVRDGAAVAVCFSSRSGPRAVEAGVETLPAFRGRGYAVAVTAAWARAVQAAGQVPLYTTSWENHASQGVARRLGLRQYATDWWWA